MTSAIEDERAAPDTEAVQGPAELPAEPTTIEKSGPRRRSESDDWEAGPTVVDLGETTSSDVEPARTSLPPTIIRPMAPPEDAAVTVPRPLAPAADEPPTVARPFAVPAPPSPVAPAEQREPVPAPLVDAPPASSTPRPRATALSIALALAVFVMVAGAVCLAVVMIVSLMRPSEAPLGVELRVEQAPVLPREESAPPVIDEASLATPPSLAEAADLVVRGEHEQAARAYSALARAHPDRPELALVARILEEKR